MSETDPEHRPALGYSLLSHGYFLELGHPERMPLMESGLALLRSVEDGTGMRWGLYMMGVSAEAAGDRAGARAHLEEGLALATERRDDGPAATASRTSRLAPIEEAFTRLLVLADLARVEVARGRLDEAEGYVRDSLARAEPHGWPVQLISVLAALAALEAARGAIEPALELAHVVMRHAAAEHVHVQQMQARAASVTIEDVARTFLRGRPAGGPQAGRR